MAYKQFVPLPNLNFQFNRVLSGGPEACREKELWEIAPSLTEFNGVAWHDEWNKLAGRAESQGRHMHAAHYHRMSEFFLPDRHPRKDTSYADFQRCFYEAVKSDAFERAEVPYSGGYLPAMRISAPNEKGMVVLHGGFDSFMEEFYLSTRQMIQEGYSIIAFEGPGQGSPLRQGLKMDHQWEKPVAAILDHFELNDICLIGISLGGYLALRAATHDRRISKVVAFDVVWDALAAFASKFKDNLYDLVIAGKGREVETLIDKLRRSNDMLDWMVSHGMHITGAKSPFEYLQVFSKFSAREISPKIKQDVLLLAGENDHFVPPEFYSLQMEALCNARSVQGRFFRAGEKGDQHCQIGYLDLAWGSIIAWLNSLQ